MAKSKRSARAKAPRVVKAKTVGNRPAMVRPALVRAALAELRRQGSPAVLSDGGAGEFVVQTKRAYSRQRKRLELLESRKALDDAPRGALADAQTYGHEEVFEHILPSLRAKRTKKPRGRAA
jgi:hypothetical protein